MQTETLDAGLRSFSPLPDTTWQAIFSEDIGPRAVDRKPGLSRPPPHPIYSFVAACSYVPVLQINGIGMPHRKSLSQKALVAKPGISVTSPCRGMKAF